MRPGCSASGSPAWRRTPSSTCSASRPGPRGRSWTRCARRAAAGALRQHLGPRPGRARAGDRGRAAHRHGAYGTGKAAIEALLHRETIAGGVPSVVLHPGHITGPWPSITPAGNLDLDVWRRLATGEPLALPELGLGVLHHVHADDVAQAFERALARPAAIGSSFHVVSEQAMTLRGLAAGVAGWFGREPVLDLVDWAEFERRVGADHAEATREHVGRGSRPASTARARCSATGPATARSTRSASRSAGWRRTGTSTSTASASDRSSRGGRAPPELQPARHRRRQRAESTRSVREPARVAGTSTACSCNAASGTQSTHRRSSTRGPRTTGSRPRRRAASWAR